ncbi:MAG: TonB-dependent hemoglobin/transferrin/lactoferrin family receptor [bacterium]|nr:TonB-dependent hemoglobin/transferrin/lactoferrin family receptor [bacterium]
MPAPASGEVSNAIADETVEPHRARRFLDALTVTATRTEHAVDEVPGTVSVITRRQIETQVIRDVRDLVRYEPGVYIEGSTSQSGLGGLNIRGVGGNRVQTRIDGVPIAEEFEFGHFEVPPYTLPLESVERIEILRGAASSLYGSDALGGVVSLVTRDPTDYLAGRSGSYLALRTSWDGRDESVSEGVTWAGRSTGWQASISVDHSTGHERDNQGDIDTADSSRTAPDPQDRSAFGLLGKLVHQGTPSNEIELTIEGLDRRVETRVLSSQGTTNLGAIFGFGPEVTYLVDKPAVDAADEQRRWRFSLEQSLTGKLADHLLWRLHTQSNQTEQDTKEIRVTTRGGGPFGALKTTEVRRDGLMRFEQDSAGGELQARQAFGGSGANLLTLGSTFSIDRFDQLRDRPETDLLTGEQLPSSDGLIFPTKYFPESRVLEAGFYAQAELSFLDGRLNLTPGLRYDHLDLSIEDQDPIFLSGNRGTPPPVELKEGALSPKLGLVASLGNRITLHAQYAHGFRAPPYSAVNSGFTHLAGGQTRLPNPELRPESSDGFELGLRGSARRTSFSVTAFSNNYRDFIELVVLGLNPATGLTEFQQQNVTRARISGLEAAAQVNLGSQWELRTSAAYIEGQDRSQSAPLNSIHPPQFVLGLARESSDRSWHMEIAGRLVMAKRSQDLDQRAFQQFPAPSYEVLDFFAGWKLTESVVVDAGLLNLLDETYWSWAEALGQRGSSPSLNRHTEAGRTAAVSLRYRR